MTKIILNMIVRDEEHCIEETLTCMLPYISYYVICDTGSVDNTKGVIRNFFDKHSIDGEIHDSEWLNFGHNRTEALQLCTGKGDYIWVIDADDIIVGDLILPELTADSYTLTYGDGFSYHRCQIFKNDPKFNWRYVGVLHEYPAGDNSSKEHINGKYYVDSRRLGARNKDPNKYLKDAATLEKGLEDEPDNERYVFYLAQSYFDHGQTEKGIELYKKRIEMGRWHEEVYYSYYRIARGYQILNKPWEEIEKAYLTTYNKFKTRAEPLYELAYYYRHINNFENAYKYAKMASEIPFPSHLVLFVMKDVYDYKALFELSISSFYVGNYLESYLTCKKLLAMDNLPADIRRTVESNIKFSQSKVAKPTSTCLIYTDNVNLDNQFYSFVSFMRKYYNICIVGSRVDYYKLPFENVYPMDVNTLKKHTELNVDQVILYDNLNYFSEKNRFTSVNVTYIVTSNYFRLILSSGVSISLDNPDIINEYINKVHKIVLYDEDVKKRISAKYSIDTDILYYINPADENNYYTLFDNIATEYNIKRSAYDAMCNGFNIVMPKYLEAFTKNKSEPFVTKLRDIYESIPNSPEAYYYLANTYADPTKALNLIDKAVQLAKRYRIKYIPILQTQRAKYLSALGKYQESYDICHAILRADMINEDAREEIQEIRDKNLPYIIDKYIVYPKKLPTKGLTKRSLNNLDLHNNLRPVDIKKNKMKKIRRSKINIMFSITTCKRPDLFQATMNSFINCCSDIDKIDYWLCVDDNSSQEDRIMMQEKYPFFNFIFKTPEQKGHYVSMNIIRDRALSLGAKYLIHMEDDFHFVERRSYVTDSFEVLEYNENMLNNKMVLGYKENYGQILFNRNYAEIYPFEQRIPGGLLRRIERTKRYIVHEYYEPGSDKYNEFHKKHKTNASNCYWKHFSFRPGMMKCSMLKEVGVFSNCPHFELEYANDYVSKGYVTAFLDTFSCIHAGKKTWETNKVNSYVLNETNQFTIDNSFISIKILSNRKYATENENRWSIFKELANEYLPFYERVSLDDVTELNDDQKKIFLNNTFQYRRDILSDIWRHLDQWLNCKSKYLMILYDNISFVGDFKHRLDSWLHQLKNKKISNCKFIGLNPNRISSGYIIDNTYAKYMYKLAIDHGVNSIDSFFENHISDNIELNLISVKEEDSYIFSEEVNVNGFDFYCHMDSHGNDINYVGKKKLGDLVETFNNTPKASCFNTHGWIKHAVDIENLGYLHGCKEYNEGLYVKKQ